MSIKPIVLDEEIYESTLERIIARDFFPTTENGTEEEEEACSFLKEEKEKPGLDAFQATHVNEDNDAIRQLLERAKGRRKRKFQWIENSSNQHNELQDKVRKGLADKEMATSYSVPRSSLIFNDSNSSCNSNYVAALENVSIKEKPLTISHKNTRFRNFNERETDVKKEEEDLSFSIPQSSSKEKVANELYGELVQKTRNQKKHALATKRFVDKSKTGTPVTALFGMTPITPSSAYYSPFKNVKRKS